MVSRSISRCISEGNEITVLNRYQLLCVCYTLEKVLPHSLGEVTSMWVSILMK